MLTLNETFIVPDAAQAWSVINDLSTLVACVPGARVKSVDGPQAVKAEIAVRMGAMGMTFTGPVQIDAIDAAKRIVTIKAKTRETLGQSYATGDITICLGDGDGAIEAIANVGGKAAGMGEGVIVNVLTDLVRGLLGQHRKRLVELPHPSPSEDPQPGERILVAQLGQRPRGDRPRARARRPLQPRRRWATEDPESILRSAHEPLRWPSRRQADKRPRRRAAVEGLRPKLRDAAWRRARRAAAPPALGDLVEAGKDGTSPATATRTRNGSSSTACDARRVDRTHHGGARLRAGLTQPPDE